MNLNTRWHKGQVTDTYHATIRGHSCNIIYRPADASYQWQVVVDGQFSHFSTYGYNFTLTDAKQAARDYVKVVERYEATTARMGR